MFQTVRDTSKKDWLNRCDYREISIHPEQYRILAAKRMDAWDRGVWRSRAKHWTVDPTYFAPRGKGNQLRETAVSRTRTVVTKTGAVELDLSML